MCFFEIQGPGKKKLLVPKDCFIDPESDPSYVASSFLLGKGKNPPF